jgi:hypothetical protein
MSRLNRFFVGASIIIVFSLIALARAVMAVREGLEEKAANLEYEAAAWGWLLIIWCAVWVLTYKK